MYKIALYGRLNGLVLECVDRPCRIVREIRRSLRAQGIYVSHSSVWRFFERLEIWRRISLVVTRLDAQATWGRRSKAVKHGCFILEA